jgi:hypothetical protein
LRKKKRFTYSKKKRPTPLLYFKKRLTLLLSLRRG